MIEIQNVAYAYGKQKILKNVSLTIQEGMVTAMIGANGAGKSTLLNLTANLLEHQQGTILLDGVNMAQMKAREIATQVAILKQTQQLNMKIAVRDLVSFGRYPHSQGRLTDEDEVKIQEAISYMKLEDIADRYINELSGGQRQRAYIAMILAQDTKYVFLDEPLNNLDVKYSIEMMITLRKLVRDLGKTVVIVIHDINFAAAYADHIVAMKDGQIVQEGPAAQIIDKDVLKEVFDQDFHITELAGKHVCVYFQPDEII